MAESRSSPVVVAAKLRTPSSRSRAVARPDLVERLASALPERLAVVVAPTGWGKSELVAQWLAAHDGPVAYVAVDRADDDANRLWIHLLTAIGAATSVPVDDLLAQLRAPAAQLVGDVVEPLLARLAGHPLTVVIEDLHLTRSAEVDESLLALVDGRPPDVGLVVTSRSEPALQLPRRRVRDGVVDVGRGELAVDRTVARSIVADASGIELEDDLLDLLLARTEGWAAGVYLAGLSLRSTDDPATGVEGFAGDDRHLSELLDSEVLDQVDPDARAFLLGTSVLHELDGDLCDEVLARDGSAGTLAELARSNLFLVPLGSRGDHYRYHHLFREWLLLELGRTGRGAVADAHRRASAALGRRDDLVGAIDHALESGDAALVCALMIEHRLQLLDTSQHATIARWYRSLPEPPSADDSVELDLMRAWVGIIEGDLDTIERITTRVGHLLAGSDVSERVAARAGEPDLLRAYAATLRGDLAASRAALDRATDVALPPRAGPTVAWLEGVLRFWNGEPATDALEAAHGVAVAAAVPYPIVLCRSYLALEASSRSADAEAQRWVDATFAAVTEHGVSTPYLAGAHLARAQAHQARGELVDALADAELAVELAERRSDTPLASLARLVAASIHHTDGDRPAARALVDVVATDLGPLPPSPLLDAQLETVRRQLRLRQTATRRRSFSRPVEELTDREMALLRLLPGELTQRELGQALHMSFNTVKSYNRQIFRKLGVSSRDDAVAAARAAGLL